MFGDGGDAGLVLEFFRRLVAIAIGAEGHDESGDENGSGSGQGLKEGGIFVLSDRLSDGGVVLVDGADEGLDETCQALDVSSGTLTSNTGAGFDESLVTSQVDGPANAFEEFFAAGLAADAVFLEEGLEQ